MCTFVTYIIIDRRMKKIASQALFIVLIFCAFTSILSAQDSLPYTEEEVIFVNEEQGNTIAGTLSIPKGRGAHKAVILISGSGPQNRDSEVAGHKPFKVIADYLAKNGIAVLRYDDRGVGKSNAPLGNASTTRDLAYDAQSAISFLRERKDIESIGLIGHSEGGLVAFMAATLDPEQYNVPDFIIAMASPGVSGREILLTQARDISEGYGIASEVIARNLSLNESVFDLIVESEYRTAELSDSIAVLVKDFLPQGASQDQVNGVVAQFDNPWMYYFIKYDPREDISKVKVPVLLTNGMKDTQVNAQVNMKSIRESLILGGNSNVTSIYFEGLNHLFQEADSGLPTEYAFIKETISPTFLGALAQWINKQ